MISAPARRQNKADKKTQRLERSPLLKERPIMYNKKKQRIMLIIVAAILIVAMVLPLVASLLS